MAKTSAKKKAAKLATAKAVLAANAAVTQSNTTTSKRQILEEASKNKPKVRVINNAAFKRTLTVEDTGLKNHFVFFKDVIEYSDGVVETRMGITTMSFIRKCQGCVPIKTTIPILDITKGYISTKYTGVVVFCRNSQYTKLALGKDPRDSFMAPTEELWEEWKKQNEMGNSDSLIILIYCDKLQLLYNLDYMYVTLPFFFNYDSYHIDNEHYDLDKVLTRLCELGEKGKVFPPVPEITDIPEEDATENCNKTINFSYIMDNLEFNKAIITENKAIPYIKDAVFHDEIKIDDYRLPDAPRTCDLRLEILKERRITNQC